MSKKVNNIRQGISRNLPLTLISFQNTGFGGEGVEIVKTSKNAESIMGLHLLHIQKKNPFDGSIHPELISCLVLLTVI